jgi:hypothetical protein
MSRAHACLAPVHVRQPTQGSAARPDRLWEGAQGAWAEDHARCGHSRYIQDLIVLKKIGVIPSSSTSVLFRSSVRALHVQRRPSCRRGHACIDPIQSPRTPSVAWSRARHGGTGDRGAENARSSKEGRFSSNSRRTATTAYSGNCEYGISSSSRPPTLVRAPVTNTTYPATKRRSCGLLCRNKNGGCGNGASLSTHACRIGEHVTC